MKVIRARRTQERKAVAVDCALGTELAIVRCVTPAGVRNVRDLGARKFRGGNTSQISFQRTEECRR